MTYRQVRRVLLEDPDATFLVETKAGRRIRVPAGKRWLSCPAFLLIVDARMNHIRLRHREVLSIRKVSRRRRAR